MTINSLPLREELLDLRDLLADEATTSLMQPRRAHWIRSTSTEVMPDGSTRLTIRLSSNRPFDLDRMAAEAQARLEAFINRRAADHKRAMFAISFTERIFNAWFTAAVHEGLIDSGVCSLAPSNPFPQPEAIERFYGR